MTQHYKLRTPTNHFLTQNHRTWDSSHSILNTQKKLQILQFFFLRVLARNSSVLTKLITMAVKQNKKTQNKMMKMMMIISQITLKNPSLLKWRFELYLNLFLWEFFQPLHKQRKTKFCFLLISELSIHEEAPYRHLHRLLDL